ncbi:homocysteine S-methyltransferase [Saccharopolyspora sp. WRP15-2]|uniref:Homocysteine S-methyltransferase n=1 Tax=Saccharopolyspora oryzae TaxID=2997343 RepID=A0ABT4UYP7_9PSEU|nr:homocysteine S-methyltransferase [Saccharopolyspora oryzae]MDA3626843.1 homocysteine S-methyltransferase [Saccharopolyspora oryzae]
MNAFTLGGATTILDGGLATELEALGHDLSDSLWSARLLADSPEEIVAAHAAFFRAGAEIATTASYQASFEGFAARGIEREEAAKLMRRSVELARLAGDVEPGRHRWVAASIGPYGAMLADGSEYRGRYGRTKRELRDFHRPRMEVLAESVPDVFALETVPDVEEAEALVDALDGLDVPAWLSFTTSGDRTRAGQPLAEAFAVAEHAGIIAVGVNCSAPEDVLTAIEIACGTTTKPVVVYPNSGEDWDAQKRSWTGRPQLSPALARTWRDAGASVIGGCCRVRPEDISAIAEALIDPER